MGMNVGGISDFVALSEKLRAAGNGGLADELKRELRRAGEEIVQALRREVASFEDRSDARRQDGKSFRAELSQAITYQVSSKGLRVYVDRAKLPADSKLLPWAFEKASFRHPVYGGATWVTQRGHPWFAPTIAKYSPRVQETCTAAVERFLQSLK
jgi:hypothetical protein